MFRTGLIWAGAVLDLEGQIQHLQTDCRALNLMPQSSSELTRQSEQLAEGQRCAVIKWLVWRSASRRGYVPTSDASQIMIQVHPMDSALLGQCRDGWTLDLAQLRLGRQPRLAGIKHLNRLEQVMASAELRADVDELLLCDDRDELICGSRSNLFWGIAGTLFTPRLDGCGVAGRTRARILEFAGAQGWDLQIGGWSADILDQADEIFVCNSVMGIVPCRGLGGRELSFPGPLTRLLSDMLQHPEGTY